MSASASTGSRTRSGGSRSAPAADSAKRAEGEPLPERPLPLHRLVEIQARRRPGRTAVAMGDDRLGYRELDREANRLAGALRAAGCEPGDRVCFLVPKSVDAVVTILAILKADCVYVPLDPSSPPPRLAKMIRRAEPRILVAGGDVRPSVRGLVRHGEPGQVLSLGWLGERPPRADGLKTAFTRAEIEAASVAGEASHRSADDPAYIFFTSGSTGTPKGVVVTHANVYHFVRWGVDYFGIGPDDRNSGHAPLHFDLSTFDIWASFAAGAALHPVPPELNLHPRRLAEWIRGTGVTQWFSVPTALTYMASFDVVRADDFPELERVLWCGEVLPTPTLMHWMERVPRATYTNLYGPTETTVASSYHTVTERPSHPRDEIPIGVPCRGEELRVLDDDLEPVPPGEVGHLYIGGVGLSPGYWRDEEKTARAFLENPADGERIYRTGDLARVGEDGLLYFRAREDNQVKCRGYRVELGEIESALFTLDPIREAAVVAVETDGFEGTELACAYVSDGQGSVEPVEVRTELKDLLPSYMLPSRWLVLDRLPKNRNGKVDRPGLERMFAERTS